MARSAPTMKSSLADAMMMPRTFAFSTALWNADANCKRLSALILLTGESARSQVIVQTPSASIAEEIDEVILFTLPNCLSVRSQLLRPYHHQCKASQVRSINCGAPTRRGESQSTSRLWHREDGPLQSLHRSH